MLKRSPMRRTPANVMPASLRASVGANPEYLRCAIDTPEYVKRWGKCEGRITREHAIINAGKKLQEEWAIPPFCAKHHGVDFHQDCHMEAPKRVREWVALNRATDEELLKYPKSGYIKLRELRNREFGEYVMPPIPQSHNGINYSKVIVDEAMNMIVDNISLASKKPFVRLTKEEEFEREVRAYARTNRISVAEARETLMELV